MAAWARHLARYPEAFDGPLLGLTEVDTAEKTELHLQVRNTSYAKYVATRNPALSITHAQRANPLGMTILAISSDQGVVVTKRAVRNDQNPGMLYLVGGYLEPPPDGDLSGIVTRTASRELLEELGILATRFIITGAAVDPEYYHSELFAVTTIDADSVAIRRSWERCRDRNESDDLWTVPVDDFLQRFSSSLVNETWSFQTARYLLQSCRQREGDDLDIRSS